MHQHQVLEITVGPQTVVIDRIVGLCRARRCRIVALHYLAADAHAPGVVRLVVSAPAARTRLLRERLRALVDVLGVEDGSMSHRAAPEPVR